MADLDAEDFRLIARERAGEVIKLRAEVEQLKRHLDWIGRVAPPDEPATALRAHARLVGSPKSDSGEAKLFLVDRFKHLPKDAVFYCVNCDESMTVETLRKISCGLDNCPIFKPSPSDTPEQADG